MTDLFEDKSVRPMLAAESGEAFNSPDYIYELKLDGERCIAYLDPEAGTELRGKLNVNMLPRVPELADLHLQVGERCVLDGELVVFVNGKPNFSELQMRSLTAIDPKRKPQGAQHPATFVAFDILYVGDNAVTELPLMKRKKLLKSVVRDNARLTVSRYIERRGVDFYSVAEKQGLDGVVAKRKDSAYVCDSRTRDWINIKNSLDEDYIVCGYIDEEEGAVSVVFGQFRDRTLVYKGRVTLDSSEKDLPVIRKSPRLVAPPFEITPSGIDGAVWLEPSLVCTVKYTSKTKTGYMWQPVFKGIRYDKRPEECTVQA